MGERSVALIDSPDGYAGVKAGTVLGWTVYESSGIVDSTSETPTGKGPTRRESFRRPSQQRDPPCVGDDQRLCGNGDPGALVHDCPVRPPSSR